MNGGFVRRNLFCFKHHLATYMKVLFLFLNCLAKKKNERHPEIDNKFDNVLNEAGKKNFHYFCVVYIYINQFRVRLSVLAGKMSRRSHSSYAYLSIYLVIVIMLNYILIRKAFVARRLTLFE
jgi:hypothetical protein